MTEESEFDFRQGQKLYLFSITFTPALEPISLLAREYRWLLPRGKAAGGESDYSPASSAEVKNMWIYPSIPDISSRRGA
jgi:hypothetical protein